MDKLAELSHGAKVVLGAAIAFLIVSFFNWQEVDLGPVEAGRSGWAGIGVIAGLLAIVIIVWQAVRLANINIEVGVTPSMITAALAVLLVVFTFIKFISDSEFRTFWAWLGLILAVVVAAGAWANMKAAGEGLSDVRAKVESMTASASGGAAAAPAAAPESPAASAAPAVEEAADAASDAGNAAADTAEDEHSPSA
jgi:hypothetical protein